ncbi:hypothetical protein ACSS6W_008347 [Trichoderma asperelloides]
MEKANQPFSRRRIVFFPRRANFTSPTPDPAPLVWASHTLLAFALRPPEANLGPPLAALVDVSRPPPVPLTLLSLRIGFGGGGSWADEVEETYGTQPLPPARDSARSGGGMSSWQDRGYSVRESIPSKLPERPPFTAHLGNLSYDATSESVTAFFEGCDVVSVRIIEDRELQRPKGFGYVEFGNVEGLKKALNLDGESFEGRMIKIKVADPPRGGDGRDGRSESTRDLSDWTRRGPLPDLGPSRGPRSDFGERRPRDPASEGRAPREMNWERRGPLSPTVPQESGSRESSRARGPQEGLGERSESYRGNRRDPATWGEGNGRPPRQYNERPERPERTATAAEKDFQWRSNMRPDAANAPAAETPASPGAAPAQPAGRPRLNLQKRTVSEAADSSASAASDSKASPFGAARPIDTAAREKEIEEKRLQAIQEKREADEKAKEEKRLAKEAAAAKAEAEAEAKEAAEAVEAKAEAKAEAETETKPEGEAKVEGETQNVNFLATVAEDAKVEIDLEEHVEWGWFTEEEVRTGRALRSSVITETIFPDKELSDGGKRVMEFTSQAVWGSLLEAFSVGRELGVIV